MLLRFRFRQVQRAGLATASQQQRAKQQYQSCNVAVSHGSCLDKSPASIRWECSKPNADRAYPGSISARLAMIF